MTMHGIRKVEDMIGRADLLQLNATIIPWKAKKIDFSKILYKPKVPGTIGTYYKIKQNHAIDTVLDRKLINLCKPALKENRPVKHEIKIKNVNRATGAMLSGEVCRLHGEEGLVDDTIHIKFIGVGGQSFGAFLSKGITFELEGMTNDYVGKGISGGKIIVYPCTKNAIWEWLCWNIHLMKTFQLCMA